MLEYENYAKYKDIMTTVEILVKETETLAQSESDNITTSDHTDIEMKPLTRPAHKHVSSLSPKKTEQIKAILKTWSKSLTAHGFPNIFVTQRCVIRVLWVLSLFFSVAYCIFNICSEIRGYLNYDYATHLETITEIPTLFPTISICNINPLITKEGELLIRKLFIDEYGIDLLNHTLTPTDLIEKLDHVNLKARLTAFLPEYGDANRKLLGYHLEDILIECFYNHHICSHRDFDWYYSLQYGNCYQFNSGFDARGRPVDVRQSFKPGSDNGLRLMFFLGESNNRFTSTWSTGLKIFVNNHSVKPSIFDGIQVKAATSTHIGVKRSFEYKLPRPYSECIELADYKGSEIYDFMKTSRFKYRQQDCLDLCLQKDIIETCSCYDLTYQRLYNVTPCLTASQLTCANDEFLKYTKANVNEKCSAHCPLECSEMTFDFTISSSDYPTEHAYDILKSDIHVSRVTNLTYAKFKERSVMVSIYYSQLNYLAINQLKKFEFMDLLASIGGLLGFFIGMSFLSFIEFFEIIIDVLLTILNV